MLQLHFIPQGVALIFTIVCCAGGMANALFSTRAYPDHHSIMSWPPYLAVCHEVFTAPRDGVISARKLALHALSDEGAIRLKLAKVYPLRLSIDQHWSNILVLLFKGRLLGLTPRRGPQNSSIRGCYHGRAAARTVNREFKYTVGSNLPTLPKRECFQMTRRAPQTRSR